VKRNANGTVHVERAVVSVQTRKRSAPRLARHTYHPNCRPFKDWGHVTYMDESSMVELTIDLAKLIDKTGQRAMLNRSGKSVFMGGMIVCKVVGDRSVTITEERDLPLASGTELVTP
jgi:hypothetical protein